MYLVLFLLPSKAFLEVVPLFLRLGLPLQNLLHPHLLYVVCLLKLLVPLPCLLLVLLLAALLLLRVLARQGGESLFVLVHLGLNRLLASLRHLLPGVQSRLHFLLRLHALLRVGRNPLRLALSHHLLALHLAPLHLPLLGHQRLLLLAHRPLLLGALLGRPLLPSLLLSLGFLQPLQPLLLHHLCQRLLLLEVFHARHLDGLNLSLLPPLPLQLALLLLPPVLLLLSLELHQALLLHLGQASLLLLLQHATLL
mmetsp:Transcript_35294/g.67470  ORF Transcript_35294/g.67470 Transcript_35294/m.67470 type:complete len:253 (+) Transcript_35294:716-1474(+)